MALSDFSGIVPVQYSTQIIEEAVRASAVLTLGNRIPMGSNVQSMPVPATLPVAQFVTAPGGRKSFTDLSLHGQTVTAEEIAAVVAIPDVYLEDNTINLWDWVRPRVAEAIGVALDNAVMFGVGSPASYPPGGIVAAAYSTNIGTGGTDSDAADLVNLAMSAVEVQGVNVTGHAADLVVKGALRGVRDKNGALLMGTQQVTDDVIQTIYGVPAAYVSFTQPIPDLITGGWNNLIIGVRSDIRYEINPAGVIADGTGKVIISGFTDNVTPMKVWGRFGCTIIKPVTVRTPTGAKPFATAVIAAPTGLAAGAEDAGDSSRAKAGAGK